MSVPREDANSCFPFCTVKASSELDITVIPWAACTSKTTTVYTHVYVWKAQSCIKETRQAWSLAASQLLYSYGTYIHTGLEHTKTQV